MHINVGATDAVTQMRITTKKALKAALAENPRLVIFDRTSLFESGGSFRGDQIPEGATLSVVLPCPYTNRRYYGSVKVVAGKPCLS